MPSHYLNQCCLLVNDTQGSRLLWKYHWNWPIFFDKIALKVNVCNDPTIFPGGNLLTALCGRNNWKCHHCDNLRYNDVIMSGCLLNHLFRHISKKTSKLHVTGLCEGNSPVTDEFPAQRASKAENVSIWWHHHVVTGCGDRCCQHSILNLQFILIAFGLSIFYFSQY